MRSGDVCQALDLPSSTLRYYTRVYKDFLSPTAKLPKRRDYTPRDVAILTQVMQLAASGMVIDNIKVQLTETVDLTSEEDTTTALALPGIIHRLDDLVFQLDHLQRRVDDLQSQLETERTKSWWDRLRGK